MKGRGSNSPIVRTFTDFSEGRMILMPGANSRSSCLQLPQG